VADRWRSLADRWEGQALAGARSFYVMHAILAFAAAGREEAAARAFASLPDSDGCAAPEALLEDEVAPPHCEALMAFACHEYETCIERLGRVRHLSHHCGGSVAQCDLVQLTFIEATLRARRRSLARALIAERTAQRPASPLNWQLRQRLREMSTSDGSAATRYGGIAIAEGPEAGFGRRRSDPAKPPKSDQLDSTVNSRKAAILINSCHGMPIC
jgi:hypothetical protein